MGNTNTGIKIVTGSGTGNNSYSVTDIYGIDLFTDSFKNRYQNIETEQDNNMSILSDKLFSEESVNKEEYPFVTNMFSETDSYSNYSGLSKPNQLSQYIILGLTAAIVSLLICFGITELRKKLKTFNKEKTTVDTNI